jgi:hypothetical protein
MKKLLKRMLEKLAQQSLKSVSIDDVRCVTYSVPLEEGWGGTKIKNFPPYNFFKIYNLGQQEKAIEAMERWYYDRMLQQRIIDRPKTDGGMQGGSLYKDIEALHKSRGILLREDLSNADHELIKSVIKAKVQYRFDTFNSVKKYGQKFSWDFVRLVTRGGTYVCFGGHHRISALAVCGHTHVTATVNESNFLKIIRIIATKYL